MGRDYREVVSLFRKFGFIVDESSGKGSHCQVYHEEHSDLYWTLSRKKPMSAFHVKKAIELVEEVMRRG